MTAEKPHGKNQEIQMLRGISIAFILVQHYYPALPAPAWFYEAVHATSLRSGVDLFFVISGFVISKSLLETMRTLANAKCPGCLDLFRGGELQRTSADFIMVPPAGIEPAFHA